MRTISGFFAALLLSFAAAGCNTPTRSEFSSFAQAGTSYAVAVDKLLVAAATAQVDYSSWALIHEKKTAAVNDKIYNTQNTADVNHVKKIGRLRQHAHLLGQYFGLLESLATSDSPERTQKAVGGVVAQLINLKKELSPAATALPEIGKAAADLKIRTALRDELISRHKIIREQLEIQEQLLEQLARKIEDAVGSSMKAQEETLVIKPIISHEEIKDPAKWVSNRRRILLTPMTIEELKSASRAAKELREAFEGLLSGEITTGRIGALITDIEGLLSIAETIKS